MSKKDFLQSIDDRCGTTNNITGLLVFGSTYSSVLTLLTIPLNAVIIYVLIKEHKKKYKSLFYKLLFNIAMADLLTGLISDPSAVNGITKEALGIKLNLVEVYLIHISMFLTDAVALLTLSVLSIERIIALVSPVKHHKGMKKRTEKILVFSIWPLAMLLVLPYFQIKFIRQLLVFSSINIVVTILSLTVTSITYKQKLNVKINKKKEEERVDSNKEMETALEMQLRTESHGAISSKRPLDTSDKQHQPDNLVQNTLSEKKARSQHKATRTFILMLLVFVLTYLPTAVTMVYMNACTECNCVVVHVMRDVSVLSILSSSVFRPLNFILTLKHLQASVFEIFRRRRPNSCFPQGATLN